jgi:hypothetical protein
MENKCNTECMECMETYGSMQMMQYARQPRQLQHSLANSIQDDQAHILLHNLMQV